MLCDRDFFCALHLSSPSFILPSESFSSGSSETWAQARCQIRQRTHHQTLRRYSPTARFSDFLAVMSLVLKRNGCSPGPSPIDHSRANPGTEGFPQKRCARSLIRSLLMYSPRNIFDRSQF